MSIETFRFTNVDGKTVELNDDNTPMIEFSTDVSVRMTEREKAQQHGLYPSNTYFGKRTFTAEGQYFGDTAAEAFNRRLEILAALMPKSHLGFAAIGTLAIRFTGQTEDWSSECTLEGYPQLPIQALSPGRGPYMVALKSLDPRLYGPWQTQAVPFGTNEQLGGRSYNKTFNKTYSTTGSSAVYTSIVNSGQIETYPEITFYGPATNPRLVMYRADGSVIYFTLQGLTLTDITDYVVVDFLRRTAIRASGANAYNYTIGSTWFSLEPAPSTNYIQYNATAGSAPSRVDVRWRNAYML